MEQMINELMDMGMEQFMDASRRELAASDGIYKKDQEDAEALQRRCEGLGLTNRQRMFMDDYVCCIKSAGSRYADISYMAGIKDAVRMFIGLGMLKDM